MSLKSRGGSDEKIRVFEKSHGCAGVRCPYVRGCKPP